MPQPPFVQRPSTRRRIMNLITSVGHKINELGSHLGVQSGTTFYVSNATGSNGVDDQAHGRSPTLPFATIAYAITQCTASKGDVILAGEGHAETVNSAGFIAMSKAGVTLKGVGYGSSRPTLTWATNTAATMTVSAAGCRITNFIFDMSLPSALVSGIVVSAAQCMIDSCLFKIGTAGTGTRPLQAILTTAAADYLVVQDCMFIEPTTTPTTVSAASTVIKIVGGTGLKILRNFFQGWYTTSSGAIACITTLTSAVEIRDNLIFNQTASSTKAITLLTGSTGFVVNNRMQILSGTAPITGDGVMWAGNYYAATIATAGTLV